MKNLLSFDFNNMMAESLSQHGITETEISNIKAQIENAKNKVFSEFGKGMMGWTNLMDSQTEIIADIIETSQYIKQNFDNFVVLGIGGSALGPIAVFQALKHLNYNDLPKSKRKTPKFYVVDNVDPERLTALLQVIDIKKTMFNVITKSGATSETMSQYLLIVDLLKKEVGADYNKHIIATTDSKKGNLIKLAQKENFKTFFIPDGVGGRFSELSPVGLLPASVLGIDIGCMLSGAEDMHKICCNDELFLNPALLSATLMYISMLKGKNISVMMPYADSLKYFADWYCQLWGESLGKSKNLNGESVYVGQTPVKALGVTDQHSQIQLYSEGPFDKVITFIEVKSFRSTITIPQGCAEFNDVNFLCGHTFNDLMANELRATKFALTKANRPNFTITLPIVNAYTIGQLMYYFQMETAFAGALLNIDTFNQPGVEEGKNATYALFGRAGYEKQKAELDSAKKANVKFILDNLTL